MPEYLEFVFENVTKKNGSGSVTYLWRRDPSKPRCYREGMEYKFNSEIVSRVYANKR